MIPIRVKACQPTGLLKPIVYVDLVGVPQEEAKQKLLDSLRDRLKPESEPAFPGEDSEASTLDGSSLEISPLPETVQVIAEPKAFPSALSQVQQIKEKSLQQRFDGLMTKYEKLSKQRDYTTNAADRDDQERQLAAIAEDMEKVAAELDALGK